MKKLLNVIILGLQGAATFFTLLVIYMIFVLLDYQGGIDSFIGTIVFQPIMGAILSITTIGICLLVGLPIRMNRHIHSWWIERLWLPIVGIWCGIFLMVISVLPPMMDTVNITLDDQTITKQVPHTGAAITGWFLISFSLLHVFPPKKLRRWTEQIISKYTGDGSKTPAETTVSIEELKSNSNK